MSTVILDTITGKSTSTNITIGSTPVVSASANSLTIRGEGTAQTSIQQGLCKAWVHVDQIGTFEGNVDSFNHGTTVDNGQGIHSPIYINPMASANNIVHYSADIPSNAADNAQRVFSVATTGYSIQYYSGASAEDNDPNMSSTHGDLA
jgi:hypothetical protein